MTKLVDCKSSMSNALATKLFFNSRAVLTVLLSLLLGVSSTLAHADGETRTETKKVDANADPIQVVSGLTDDMMAIIKNDGELFKKDPSAYYKKIQNNLESTVAFGLIARNVMGKYGKLASDAQRDQFAEVFSRSLSETLGKGLANYSDLKVSTLPFDSKTGDLAVLRKVEVVQEVEAVDGTTHVSYTMAKNNSGEWKLVNVILNGVNLGKQFRNQFKQAMKQHDNNIEKVIESWSKPA